MRLRSVAHELGLPALDVAASTAPTQMLSPSLCCELLREVGREEARARLEHGVCLRRHITFHKT